MEVGQNIKFEFISKFKLKFPEISKLIDFEINENGNILTGVKVESNFILNEICFYKKKGISEEKFTKALLVFQTNYNIRPDPAWKKAGSRAPPSRCCPGPARARRSIP